MFEQVTPNVNSLNIEVSKEFIFECSTGRGSPKAFFEWYLDDQIYATSHNESSVSYSLKIRQHWQLLCNKGFFIIAATILGLLWTFLPPSNWYKTNATFADEFRGSSRM